MVIIKIKGEIMEKEFWKSMTFWGAVLWALVGVFEIYAGDVPKLGDAAQAVSIGLVAFGIRRAQG